MSTILSSIKTQLGVSLDDTSFDTDLIIFINDALFDIKLLGPGKDGVTLMVAVDGSTTWESLFDTDEIRSAVDTFVYLSVKLVFDPPQTSFGIAALERRIKKRGWQLTVAMDEKEGYPYETEDS